MPEYKIGLDFGTTNSILSYLDNNNNPTAFKYGHPGQHEEYIPSFIAYEDGFVEIGTSARNTASKDRNTASKDLEAECYGNFKMRLPLSEEDFAQYFQNNKTPIKITADYLKELLLGKDNTSFTRENGNIVGLVVSVPEIWQRDICNLGRERLQKLIEDLDLPLIQLVSEPVAAASYYTYEVQKKAKESGEEPFKGNLLVCDMGGGTFDVSLCHISGDNKVEVLYFDGQGDKGLDCAGVAFDRRCVQTAYQKKNDTSLNENSPQFVRLLRAFETEKITSNPKITKKLKNYLKDPENYSKQDLYTFDDGYGITFEEVMEAFKPIEEGINKVINTIKEWLKTNNQTFNRIFLVGGFSQFYLVQKNIRDALEIEEDDERFDHNFNVTNSAYAISYGACLIANSLIEPTEKYVHTLGITVKKQIPQEGKLVIKKEEITLIQGGQTLDQLNNPIFCEQPFTTFMDSFQVPIWIDRQSKNIKFQEDTPDTIILPNYSKNAKYYVGMKINRSHIAYLIIEEASSKERVEYELGEIFSKIFSGFYITED